MWVAGVVGSHPSVYSKSPRLWSAGFSALGLPVVYVPLDVHSSRLDGFFSACRAIPRLLGVNVTVPYKERVIRHLDDIDSEARRIGAVNTVVRTSDGRLLGANTDGLAVGAVLSRRLKAQGSGGRPPVILVLGGGGSARAAAVGLGRALPGADILILNRTPGRAEQVASAVNAVGAHGHVLSANDLDRRLPEVGALVNATSVGMAGVIEVPGGITWLEPFSALAPAPAPLLENQGHGSLRRNTKPPQQWMRTTWAGIAANLEVSMRRALRLRREAFVLDLVYAPAETVLLKHVRWTGHDGVNGLPVLVAQAAEALVGICAPLLDGRDPAEVRRLVESAMSEAL